MTPVHTRRPQSQSSKGQRQNLVSLTWVEIGRWVTRLKPNQYSYSKTDHGWCSIDYIPRSKLSEAVSFDHWEWDLWSQAPAWPSRWWTPAPGRKGRRGSPRAGGAAPAGPGGPGGPAAQAAHSWPGTPAPCYPPETRGVSAPTDPAQRRHKPRSPQNTWEHTAFNNWLKTEQLNLCYLSNIHVNNEHTVDIFVVLLSLCPTWRLLSTCLVSNIFGIFARNLVNFVLFP